MCAIAKRADSSIGSLYQFFPNKESLIDALRAKYVQEMEKVWAALAAEVASLTVVEVVSRLINSQIDFAESHPGFYALFEAPPTAHTSQRRELIRRRIARVLLAFKPGIPSDRVLRFAAVVHEIIKGLMRLYAVASTEERELLLEEFKGLMIGYLGQRLNR